MSRNIRNSFDIDGVIDMDGPDGVYPGPNDVIITGRSFEEEKETRKMLKKKGIKNEVYMNPLPYKDKTRKTSGMHKANTINMLEEKGKWIGIHFEDDPIQAKIIKENTPDTHVVLLKHDLVIK